MCPFGVSARLASGWAVVMMVASDAASSNAARILGVVATAV